MEGKKRKIAIKTVKELAEAMCVAERTILRWKKRGLPPKVDGFFDLEAVRIWREKMLGRIGTKMSDGEPYWREMIAKNRALLLEVKLKKLEGKLIPKEYLNAHNRMRVLGAKNAFFFLPEKIAPVLEMKTRKEIEILLRKAIREIIDDFGDDVIGKDDKGNETK